MRSIAVTITSQYTIPRTEGQPVTGMLVNIPVTQPPLSFLPYSRCDIRFGRVKFDDTFGMQRYILLSGASVTAAPLWHLNIVECFHCAIIVCIDFKNVIGAKRRRVDAAGVGSYVHHTSISYNPYRGQVRSPLMICRMD